MIFLTEEEHKELNETLDFALANGSGVALDLMWKIKDSRFIAMHGVDALPRTLPAPVALEFMQSNAAHTTPNGKARKRRSIVRDFSFDD